MPRCLLKKHVWIHRQHVEGFSHAILLKEGDRWTVVDPANDNELIRGMTDRFLEVLIDKGMLTIIKDVP